MGRLGKPALLFIQVVDYKHLGGNMIALGTDAFKYILINPTSQKADAIVRYRTAHVWIRLNDGVDRSPYPRRVVRRRNSGASHRRTYEETDCYKPFQPNPCNNYIGDCVVRAVSGVMGISWSDAIDLLSSANETTVNVREVYPKILEQNGFSITSQLFAVVVISMAYHSAMRCTRSTTMLNASLLMLAGHMWPLLYQYTAVMDIPHTKSSTAGTVQKGLSVTIG